MISAKTQTHHTSFTENAFCITSEWQICPSRDYKSKCHILEIKKKKSRQYSNGLPFSDPRLKWFCCSFWTSTSRNAWFWPETVDQLKASWLQNSKTGRDFSLWHQMNKKLIESSDCHQNALQRKKGSSVGTVTGVFLKRHLTWGRGSPPCSDSDALSSLFVHTEERQVQVSWKIHLHQTREGRKLKICRRNTTPLQSTTEIQCHSGWVYTVCVTIGDFVEF